MTGKKKEQRTRPSADVLAAWQAQLDRATAAVEAAERHDQFATVWHSDVERLTRALAEAGIEPEIIVADEVEQDGEL